MRIIADPHPAATAAVHHHLIRKGLCAQAGIIVEAGDVWEVHHYACLIGSEQQQSIPTCWQSFRMHGLPEIKLPLNPISSGKIM
jgi:hypothetical protein